MSLRPDRDVAFLNQIGEGTLPGYLGVVITGLEPGVVRAELPVRPELLAPNRFLHAGTVVTLADTATRLRLLRASPGGGDRLHDAGAEGELSPHDARGVLRCEARALHMGRTTHVWDASVSGGEGAPIAVFRCTQLVLYETAADGRIVILLLR